MERAWFGAVRRSAPFHDAPGLFTELVAMIRSKTYLSKEQVKDEDFGAGLLALLTHILQTDEEDVTKKDVTRLGNALVTQLNVQKQEAIVVDDDAEIYFQKLVWENAHYTKYRELHLTYNDMDGEEARRSFLSEEPEKETWHLGHARSMRHAHALPRVCDVVLLALTPAAEAAEAAAAEDNDEDDSITAAQQVVAAARAAEAAAAEQEQLKEEEERRRRAQQQKFLSMTMPKTWPQQIEEQYRQEAQAARETAQAAREKAETAERALKRFVHSNNSDNADSDDDDGFFTGKRKKALRGLVARRRKKLKKGTKATFVDTCIF